MGQSYVPAAPSQSCLSHTQRTLLAQRRFTMLDKNNNGKLSRRDLRKLRYKRMPLEHCAIPFFQSCDSDRNRKVTLQEWTTCLVDHTEAWFYHFMFFKSSCRITLCQIADFQNFLGTVKWASARRGILVALKESPAAAKGPHSEKKKPKL
ncbi:hypothetical protein JOQ06_019773 [Pogonophryne albipinna]|uniref:SPARC/Testican calcium-binding domain-containing protein n=1 Tax=Pogonophryne albipinna TaxID=1090488 RepID=A0AAD6BQD5_9TELE|nr:hypothetical protein JOQ06_019773 [Pogonophryne albipinna]